MSSRPQGLSWIAPGLLLPTLRHAARRVVGRPVGSLVAVIVVGLGILCALGPAGLIYGSLLRGLPFPEAHQLVTVDRRSPEGRALEGVSSEQLRRWRQQLEGFEGLGGFYTGTVNLRATGFPERFDGTFVTANLFELLGVEPALGRGLAEGDDLPGAPRVVVLGDRAWRRHFDADPRVLGQRLRVNGQSATVIGVMGPGFRFPKQQDLWIPLTLEPPKPGEGESQNELDVLGRLSPGVTLEQARERLGAVAPGAPGDDSAPPIVGSLLEWYMPAHIRRLFSSLVLAGGLVLVIACANVASLLLARTSLRVREIATRRALGASRDGLIADQLAESSMIAVGGGLVAWGAALVFDRLEGGAAIQRDPVPYWADTQGDPTLFAILLGLVVLAAVLGGLVPALQASRGSVAGLLQDDSRSVTGLRIGRFHRGLVVFEVAAACALLVCAGLMLRTSWALDSLALSEGEHLLSARVGLFDTRYPDPEIRQRFFARLVETLAAVPGVEGVALSSNLPAADLDRDSFERRGGEVIEADQAVVTPGYFALFELPLLEGRLFDGRDGVGGTPVAVVSERFAKRAWPGEDPLGRQIRGRQDVARGAGWRTVVGVVPNMPLGEIGAEDGGGVYLPLEQDDKKFISFVVRLRPDLAKDGDLASLEGALRQAVVGIDPDLPIYWVRTLDEVLAEGRFFHDFFGRLFFFLGAAALLLATLGVYGVMAFGVSHRAHEIGIRLALGARPTQVIFLLLGQGAGYLVLGLPIGLLLGWGVGHGLGIFLYQVDSLDPTTYIVAPLLVTGITLLACWLPIRRLFRRAPMDVLRYE